MSPAEKSISWIRLSDHFPAFPMVTASSARVRTTTATTIVPPRPSFRRSIPATPASGRMMHPATRRPEERGQRSGTRSSTGSLVVGQAATATRTMTLMATARGNVSRGRGTPRWGRSALASNAHPMRVARPAPTTRKNWEARLSRVTRQRSQNCGTGQEDHQHQGAKPAGQQELTRSPWPDRAQPAVPLSSPSSRRGAAGQGRDAQTGHRPGPPGPRRAVVRSPLATCPRVHSRGASTGSRLDVELQRCQRSPEGPDAHGDL